MRIIVGIDGSEGSAAAAAWAAREVQLHGGSVRGLYAWSLLGQPPGTFDPTFGPDDALEAVDRWIDAAAFPLAVEPMVALDLPTAALVDASADADLVVVGARGLGGFSSLLLGSVSSTVAERAACPVAVVRGATLHALGPVVVGVDGSALSLRALRWAAEEARVRAAPLEIVHAWADTSPPMFGVPVPVPLADAAEAAEHLLTEAMAAVDLTGLVVRRHAPETTAAGALVARSQEAAVVVVGSRGRGAMAAMLLGSTSRHVLHHAACPVVVAR